MRWRHGMSSSASLTPLPPKLHAGLIAISILSSISFLVTTALFFYLTYKLILWCIRPIIPVSRHRSRGRHVEIPPHPMVHPPASAKQASDFTLGIDGIFTDVSVDDASNSTPNTSTLTSQSSLKDTHNKPVRPPPNQFLILIYNLLLADMHQSVAFALNGAWLRADGILVDTRTCFTQGIFVSTGDLSSSMFITAIAIHTYLSVVKGYRPPHFALYLAIISIWTFVYLISALPILATRNGLSVGGFFVRAGAWCWMNESYEQLRLFTHYLFIFMGLTTTAIVYIAIYIHLRRRTTKSAKSNYHPAFLLYPIIYIACTLPLAAGRISTMAGAKVPVEYFCFAGAIIACNGFFDCLLFGTTRNTIIFATTIDGQETGLETFAFLQTPSNRRFGNMIWVQGGERKKVRLDTQRSTSQESLRQAIQLETVTTVVVEGHGRNPNYAYSEAPSILSLQTVTPKYM